MKLNGRQPAGFRKGWSWMSRDVKAKKAYKIPKIETEDMVDKVYTGKSITEKPYREVYGKEKVFGSHLADMTNKGLDEVMHGTKPEIKRQVKLKIIKFKFPIPKFSLDQFMFIFGMTVVILAIFLGVTVFGWVRDDIEYKQQVREEVRYNIEKALTVERAKIASMEYQLQELDGFKEAVEHLVRPKTRKKRKYRIGHSNKYIVR